MNDPEFFLITHGIKKALAFSFIFLFGLFSIIGSGGGGGGDKPGTLQFSSASYTATEGSDPVVTITVTRSNGSKGAISANYATADGTASQPDDYTLTSGTLNWTDGDTASQSFDITIIDDSDVEVNQVFTVSLTSSNLGSPSTATVTIISDDLIPINGTVSAPAGALAFKTTNWLEKMFASILGSQVIAAISDHVSPVSGATVSIYEIDASGSIVGSAKDSTTTDGTGSFTLNAPIDVLDSVKYIVRATGTTETMDSLITGTTINVDPSTDATSRMVFQVTSSLAEISAQEVIEMQEDIAELITDIDTGGVTASTLSDRLFNETNSRVGLLNIHRSKVSSGQICGHVQTTGASSIEGIRITLRDYNDWTHRANTYTDASGDYCLNAPVQGTTNPDGGTFSGEYIIGAINRTDDVADAARSASEWLGSGTTYTQYEASKISVLNTTTVSGVDFSLEAGARITGTVKATGSLAAVEGTRVVIRDFVNRRRLASARVEADGSYRVNVVPGTYLVSVINSTTAAYASEYYDASTGTHIRNLATPVSANAGDEVTLDFVLEAGNQLSGTVNDGTAVMATSVNIDIATGGTFGSVATDRNGDYNVWLMADSYDIYAYGQRSLALNLSSSTIVDFSSTTVSMVSAHLEDSSTNPSRRAAIRLFRKDDPTTTSLMAYGRSDSKGDFTVYTDMTGDHLLDIRTVLDSGTGSIISLNHTSLLSGDIVNIAAASSSVDVGTVDIPDGGLLTGHVYTESFGSVTLTPMMNFRVQVRDDDDLTTQGSGNTLTDRFVQVRTGGDGSYAVALPAGIYDRIKMRDATGTGNCGSPGNGITITSGATTVLDFYDGDNNCNIQ